MKSCSNCAVPLTKRSQLLYCSNKCQTDARYKIYIQEWKKGTVSGNKGIVTKNISGHLKRYLIEKYGERCLNCNWNKCHPRTDAVPLEIDHIDGNAENNTEKNLRLLCPNCHALTSNYKNFNKGNGRTWRTKRYLKVRP